MYPAKTILVRNTPRKIEVPQPDEGLTGTTEVNDPYNVVSVIGPSPVKKASVAEWGSGTGEFLLVSPVEEFGAVEVIPSSVLQEEYTVRTYGDEEPAQRIVTSPERSRVQQLTPEQQFAAAAREQAKEEAAAVKGKAKVASA